jgi:antirestriction protein ArdC
MKIEQAKQLTEQALDKLIQALEAGKSETLKVYLATMSRFRRYSWGNVLLIAFQRPDASYVAGFNRWKELGRHVKKGEKGIIIILAPITVSKKENDAAETQNVLVNPRVVLHYGVSQESSPTQFEAV